MALSGDARMGFVYDGDDVNLNSRARVTFTLSGETDGGLAFGGSFRADNATGAAAGSAGSVFISGEFGRLSMGDVDSAALAATGDLFSVGLTGLGDLHEMQYVGRLFNDVDGTANAISAAFADANGDPVPTVVTGLSAFPRALYTYSIDGFSVHASVAFDKSRNVTATFPTDPPVSFGGTANVVEASIGASYELDGFMVAAGYENARIKLEDFDPTVDGTLNLGHATVAAGYTIEGVSIKAIYGRAMDDLADLVEDKNQYGLGVSGSFDAVTVSAYGRRDFAKTQYLGVGASYDLGGGASIRGGVVNTNPKGSSSTTIADFGLAFTF